MPIARASVAAASLVLIATGCGGGDPESWRDNCVNVVHDTKNSKDYFVDDAWGCQTESGKWTVVYTFASNDARDAAVKLGEGFGAEILDTGERWAQADIQPSTADPCFPPGSNPACVE